jgi:hypothetical protein
VGIDYDQYSYNELVWSDGGDHPGNGATFYVDYAVDVSIPEDRVVDMRRQLSPNDVSVSAI